MRIRTCSIIGSVLIAMLGFSSCDDDTLSSSNSSISQTLKSLESCADGTSPIAQDILRVGGVKMEVAVQGAAVSSNNDGSHNLLLRFTDQSAVTLGELTSKQLNTKLDVSIGDDIIMSPIVREAIWGGALQISGDFTREELGALASRIEPKCGD